MNNKQVTQDQFTEPTNVSIPDPQPVRSLAQVRAMKPKMIFYATATCWWTANPDDLYTSVGLPSDPRGCTLFETEDVEGFLKSAEEHPDHYGEYGLDAFILAYHGNVVTADGRPTSFRKWDSYNALLKEEK